MEVVLPESYLKMNADNCRKYLNNLLEAGEYLETFNLYVHYFQNVKGCENITTGEMDSFAKVLVIVGDILEAEGNYDKLILYFLQGLNFFPKHVLILYNFGLHMFRLGHLFIAKRYFEEALKHSNGEYIPAEKNLLYLNWHLVPRWHFRMLNDKTRNNAYFEAIKTAVSAGYKKVIDIGSGCGILSFMAAYDESCEVVAIEENIVLHNICQKLIDICNIKNIEAVCCNSKDWVKLRSTRTSQSVKSKPRKRKKNTEFIADFNLLVTEIFDVCVFGEGVLQTLIDAHENLLDNMNCKIIPAQAFLYVTGIESDELAEKIYYNNSINELKLDNICLKVRDRDPYEAENLNMKQFSYLTDSVKGVSVNFYNIQQLKLMESNNWSNTIELKCVQNGTLHALTVWFTLDLGCDIKITTNPKVPDCLSSWEQAIFFLDHPVSLTINETIKVRISIVNSQLKLTVLNLEKCCCQEITPQALTYLNDSKLIYCFRQLAELYSDKNLTVLDMNVIPLFGLFLALRGHKVYHICYDESIRNFIKYILKINNIQLSNFELFDKTVLLRTDLILVDPLGTDGSLNSFPFDRTEEIREKLIPKELYLNQVLINSPYIDVCNKVDEKNIPVTIPIAQLMNKYTGTEHPNLERFDSVSLTPIIRSKLCWLDRDNYQESIEVDVNEDGVGNGILYWFEVHYADNIVFSTKDAVRCNTSCFLLSEPLHVRKGDKVNITIKICDSHIKITAEIEKPEVEEINR